MKMNQTLVKEKKSMEYRALLPLCGERAREREREREKRERIKVRKYNR